MNRGLCLVVGMHRSGTSLMSRCLAAYGVAHGDNLHVNVDNAKGHWEDRDLIGLNEALLARLERSWASLTPLSAQQLQEQLQPGDQAAARELVRARLAAHPLYAFKDPRTTVLLPFWLPLLQSMPGELRLVLCVRHPWAVARSLAERDGFHSLRSLALWLHYNLAAIEALASCAQPVAVVDYEHLLAQPRQELMRLGAALQLSLDETAAASLLADFIDPSLNHHGSGAAAGNLLDANANANAQPIVALALEVHAHLHAQALNGGRPNAQSLQQLTHWRRQLAPYLALTSLCDQEYGQLCACRRAEAELAEVYQTLSWRMTRPLRWLRAASLGRTGR